ncbi:unnamed protein product [Dicrocoelium dendriticum]|nr:unnamed protein product [Dicrocoelium dendriticum]
MAAFLRTSKLFSIKLAGLNGGEIYFNPMELLRVFRLHCLREQGLPDSLHILLTCRINDYVQEIQSNVFPASSTTNREHFNVNVPCSMLESIKTEFHTGRPQQEAATNRTPDLEEALQWMCLEARVLPCQMAAGRSRSSRNEHQYVDCESEDGVSGIECIACQQPQLVVDTPMDSEETRLLALYPSPRYHNREGKKKRNPINAQTRRCHHHSHYRNHQPPSCMCAISPTVAPSFESQAIQSTCLICHHSHADSHAFSSKLFIRAGYLDNSHTFVNRRQSRRQPGHVSQSTGSTGIYTDGAQLCIRTQPPHCFCTHLPKSATSLMSSVEYADYIDTQHDILKYPGAPHNADHDTCVFRNKHRVCSSSPFSTCSSYASSSDLSESSKCGTDLSDTASAGEYSFPFTVDDS